MEIEKLIKHHNEILDNKVAENVFLKQRILNQMENKNYEKPLYINLNFRKSVLTFGFLILIFTFINFTFVGQLEKVKTQTKETIDFDMKPFRADFQINLNSILREMIK